MTDQHLLDLAIRTRYVLDEGGHLVRENEPNGARAPRFFLGRTRDAVLWRARADVPDETLRRLEPLLAAEPLGEELSHEPRCAAECRAALTEQAPVIDIWTGPSFVFPDHLPAGVGTTRVTGKNSALLADTFPGLHRTLSARLPCVAVVRDGAAVSVCYCARKGDQACEAGVDTLVAFRGNGFAVAVTAAWAALIRREGLLPLYSTSWENTASRGVARRLGLRRFAADFHIT